MGHTVKPLSLVEISKHSVFNNRFVIEICERVHTHYRNLRIIQPLDEFITIAEGINQALERWKKRGCPGTGKGMHIELCRKQIALNEESNKIQVNLNDNLYNKNVDGIYSLGADFSDPQYIHIKYRDLRLEMSIPEFKEFADAVSKAAREVEVGDTAPALQA